jgi:hypothetical protein
VSRIYIYTIFFTFFIKGTLLTFKSALQIVRTDPNAQGKFVRAYTKRFEGKSEIGEAEALSVLEALQWSQNADISNVHIEVDCLQVVLVGIS